MSFFYMITFLYLLDILEKCYYLLIMHLGKSCFKNLDYQYRDNITVET